MGGRVGASTWTEARPPVVAEGLVGTPLALAGESSILTPPELLLSSVSDDDEEESSDEDEVSVSSLLLLFFAFLYPFLDCLL